MAKRSPQVTVPSSEARAGDELTIDLADPDEGVSTRPGRRAAEVTPRPARFSRGSASTAPATESKAPAVRLLPGRRVPGTRYRLVRWLGEGGMGVVYEAEHEDIERRIALKILRHEASEDPAQAARFREEARAASKIGSPNIVQIFDFGELPDGRLMFVMEMLAGHGLDGEVESAPIDQSRLIAILRQVCRGLAAAHDAGIVHRDIKPDNVILVAEGGRQDMVKIVDFGIATILTHGSADVAAAGTPQYMAPEQILGQGADSRLDMYSMGCMAYELLTGKPPFPEGGVEEILARHLDTAPVPPSRLVAEGTIHPAIEAVVLRCLAKSPGQRYADMRDLEAALCEAQIAAGLRTAWDDLPLPDVDPERRALLLSKMPRAGDDASPRRRWLWPALALGSTVLAIALAVLLTMNKPPEPGEEKIVEDLVAAAVDAGSRTHWVYGTESDPLDTAYHRVLELEATTGPAAKLARQRAGELRARFFAALTEQGDRYWDRPSGREFAAEFYSWASVFAFDEAVELHAEIDAAAADAAFKRAGVTKTMIARIQRQAADGTFSADERQVAEEIAVLAEPDEGVRAEKLANSTRLPMTQRRKLARLASGSEGGDEGDEGMVADAPSPAAPKEEVVPGAVAAETPAGTERGDSPEIKRTSTARDPKQSRKLSSEAAAALAKGQRKQAEGLFHQALAYDNRNGAALIGLSDIHFDRSEYTQAVNFAEKAAQASPRNGSYRIRLGDAYFKQLRYADARSEYDVAKQLGSKEADERLAKVKARLGK